MKWNVHSQCAHLTCLNDTTTQRWSYFKADLISDTKCKKCKHKKKHFFVLWSHTSDSPISWTKYVIPEMLFYPILAKDWTTPYMSVWLSEIIFPHVFSLFILFYPIHTLIIIIMILSNFLQINIWPFLFTSF